MQSTCHLSDNVNDEYMAYLSMFVDIYKTNLIHRQMIRLLRHGGSHFTKWLPPWRKGRIICLWIKSVFAIISDVIIYTSATSKDE